MAECVRLLPAVAALCLCLCAIAVAHAAKCNSAQTDNVERRRPRSGTSRRRPAVGEYAMLVQRPWIALYTPLDATATALLLDDREAVPDYAACAYFDASVYCVGDASAETRRFSHVDGSPLPPGPDLNRAVWWLGNGRMANINDEWLVTCGDYRPKQPNTCQVLHTNASHWVEIESEACGEESAVAQHKGSVFVAGGACSDNASAEVWSLQVSRTAVGNDTFQWRRHPDLNTARFQLAIASHNGWLYACGGQMGFSVLSDCERWQEGMQSWQSIAPLPKGRYLLHLLSVDGRLLAMGGLNRGRKLDVFDYDQAEDTWSRLHDMPRMPGMPYHMTRFGSAVVPADGDSDGGEWRESAAADTGVGRLPAWLVAAAVHIGILFRP